MHCFSNRTAAMKRLLAAVMLTCVTGAATVSADSLDAGLGVERSRLSAEQVAVRSERLEAAMSFPLLRFPEALQAPYRIFNPEIWSHIENAAREYDLDPMILAGMIFVESYGDPLAKSPTGPAGLAQMTEGSAKELGLLTGKKVRIGSRDVEKTRWVGTGRNRRRVVQTIQEPIYTTIDERYVPSRAIAAMARRVSSRRGWLAGKIDFAIAEYHMGSGRMATLLSAYFGRSLKVSEVTAEMQNSELSYAELFFTNTPYFRRDVYEALEDLNRVDFSPTYYFRVRQAVRLLNIYRKSPEAYARLASVHQRKFGWAVLPSAQWSFVTERMTPASAAAPAGTVLHQDPSDRFVLLPDIASAFGVRPGAKSLRAERSTIGAALFIAQHLKRLQGAHYNGFEIARMLAPASRRCASLRAAGHEDADEDDECAPLHALGWAFDLPTGDLSKAARRDLRLILSDLRQAGLLVYTEDGGYHIVRHPDHAARFEQFYRDLTGDPMPAERRAHVAAAAPPPSGNDEDASEMPNLLLVLALQGIFTRIYYYYA